MRATPINRPPPRRRVLICQQCLDRYICNSRVSDVPQRILIRQTHRLNQMVIRVRSLISHIRNVKPLSDLQRHQRGRYPDRSGRHSQTSVPRYSTRYRLIPIRCVRRQILLSQPTALALHKLRQLRGDRALIKRLATTDRYGLQRPAQAPAAQRPHHTWARAHSLATSPHQKDGA